jgi:hypothetical protein
VAAAAPYLAEGLAAGETVMLSCQDEHCAALTGALDRDDRIVVVDPDGICTRSGVAIGSFRRMVRRQTAAGAPRVRLVAEVPVGHGGRGWSEWHRYEAICNVTLAALPLSGGCAYDPRQLSSAMATGSSRPIPRC